jgi:hypothetical protein
VLAAEDGEVVGIITPSDLTRWRLRELTAGDVRQALTAMAPGTRPLRWRWATTR